MSRTINYKYTNEPGTIDKLLKEVSAAKVGILLFRAWMSERYAAGSTDYVLLTSVIKKQEIINKNATEYFQYTQDKLADDSVVGIRSLRNMELVYERRKKQLDALAERIKVAKEKGNITSFTDYKARKALESKDRPKGAA